MAVAFAVYVAGGVSANHIAAWNGSQWLPLGAGRPVQAGLIAERGEGQGNARVIGVERLAGVDVAEGAVLEDLEAVAQSQVKRARV